MAGQILHDSKIALLGSSGFVGSALLERFRNVGVTEIADHDSSTLDLASSDCVERLTELLDERTILILTARSRKSSDPLERFSADIAIILNVVRCLARRRIRKCLYFSSTAVYGDVVTDLNITEETPIAPTSLYGAAKSLGEFVLRQVTTHVGAGLVILRPCMIYGPGDTSNAYGPARLIRSVLEGREVSLFGDGHELRDYIFIRDVAKLVIRLALGPYCGTYNVVTGRSHSFQDIVSCLQALRPQGVKVIHVDRDRPKVNQKISPSKLLSVFPDLCFTELEQGLAKTYEYFSTKLLGGT